MRVTELYTTRVSLAERRTLPLLHDFKMLGYDLPRLVQSAYMQGVNDTLDALSRQGEGGEDA